ncbi:uncharacterized protein LOC132281923 [Cornus florida]|uniref:uncharacterized protein LOC132281923 n=1 Tax=Cornus florida TaxID=4283 RepID=UPI002896BC48|nr:uncharacterized protein LOC132281923 [Cornus florida]
MKKRKLELTSHSETNDNDDSSKQTRHDQSIIVKQSNQAQCDYRIILNSSIDCIRFLVLQARAFCDNHELSNRGHFLELLQFLASRNEVVKGELNKVPEDRKLDVYVFQEAIVNAAATVTINFIIRDIGNAFFSIIIGDSQDTSRHIGGGVNGGCATLRGQSYDGVTNMQGEFNNLKMLILKENEFVYFGHCFAYELQLALVAVAKIHIHALLFTLVANVMNVLGASCFSSNFNQMILHEHPWDAYVRRWTNSLIPSIIF